MELKMYQVDAFTTNLFKGNPAAVIPLNSWLPDELMQDIALENNLSETAFFCPSNGDFHIRWFTPVREVNLCGHATLATAHVLFNHLNYNMNQIVFHSKSGQLTVTKDSSGQIVLDLPACDLHEVEITEELNSLLGKRPEKCLIGKDDMMFVFPDEKDVIDFDPKHSHLNEINTRGIIITAPSLKYDFISRFFAPSVGINEDPVTGSAHTLLIPYWSNRLKRNELHSYQASKRGGELFCHNKGERILIGGKATTYLTGEITV